MALSGFQDDYTTRQAGLQTWLNGVGNATHAVPAYPGQTAPAAPAPPPANFSEIDPNSKALMLGQEAFAPGSASVPAQTTAPAPQPTDDGTPFRHTALGSFLGRVVPGLGAEFRNQQAKSMSDYWDSVKDTDPVTQLTGAMKVDPNNAEKYASALVQYTAQNNSPIAKTQAQEANMTLRMDQFKTHALMKGMQEAQDFLGGSQATPPAAPAPQDRANLLGPPAAWQGQKKNPAAPISGGAMAPIAGFKDSPLQAFDKYPAQTMAESGGNPNAVSSAGALGSKQIMPATGADPGFGVKPWDGTPNDNIRFGNDYYDAMLTKYKGNVPVALAAYNMGPGKTDSWLQAGADPAKLPQETMSYVTKLAPQMQAAVQGSNAQPAQAMTPLQQHQQLVARNVAEGLAPASELRAALDPTNPANIPTQKMEGDTLFTQKPGEAPRPYAVPPMNGSTAKQEPDGTILPSKHFGFTLPPMTTASMKIQQENDKAAQLAAQNNLPIIRNAQRYIDALEPSLNDLKTGKGSEFFQGLNATVNGIIPGSGGRMSQMANDYGNITSTTQSLALELAKLQPGQGSKGNKLALQTLINSKPGMGTPNQTNTNSLNDMRAKLSDIETSADLDQQYRAVSPYGTTDANTRALDDALKTIYPLQSVDKTTGNVIFNQHNADAIRRAIPDAIRRPDGYLKQAQLHGGTGVSYDPTRAAEVPESPPQSPNDMIAAELARRQAGGT